MTETKNMSSSRSSSQTVKASHILVKHQGSRRKASWKDPEGVRIKATSRDSAVQQLLMLKADIVSGKARFEDVASRYSDCSSAKRGGDLGMSDPHRSLFSFSVWQVFFFGFILINDNIQLGIRLVDDRFKKKGEMIFIVPS